MGQGDDDKACARGNGQMLLPGGREPFGKMWTSKRYSCAIARELKLMCFSDRYLELLKDSKIKGYLFEQQNYVPK